MKKSITIRLLAFFMLIGGVRIRRDGFETDGSGKEFHHGKLDAGKRRRDIQCVL